MGWLEEYQTNECVENIQIEIAKTNELKREYHTDEGEHYKSI